MNQECLEKIIDQVIEMIVSVKIAKDETFIVEGDIGYAFYCIEEGHFNISVDIAQRRQKRISARRKDTGNPNLCDTTINGNGEKNVNENGNSENKTVKTHTPKTTSINKGGSSVTFTQAVGDDKVYESASGYDYDEIFRTGCQIINAHSKHTGHTTQLAKKQSSHASNYDSDIETNTIGSKSKKKQMLMLVTLMVILVQVQQIHHKYGVLQQNNFKKFVNRYLIGMKQHRCNQRQEFLKYKEGDYILDDKHPSGHLYI